MPSNSRGPVQTPPTSPYTAAVPLVLIHRQKRVTFIGQLANIARAPGPSKATATVCSKAKGKHPVQGDVSSATQKKGRVNSLAVTEDFR